jgi:hypothetical protein
MSSLLQMTPPAVQLRSDEAHPRLLLFPAAVASGLVATLPPGGQYLQADGAATDLSAKRLQLLKETVRSVSG